MEKATEKSILEFFDNKERLVILDGLAVFKLDLQDPARELCFDFIHQFHGFDDAENLAFLDSVADFHVGIGVRCGRTVERTDHGRFQLIAAC